MKIKKGDSILVISGRDKGRKGKIIQTLAEKQRVVVENINLRKKNVRAKKSGEKGQIVEFPAPLNVSNVMLICSGCGKPAKTKTVTDKLKKYRACKKCGKEV